MRDIPELLFIGDEIVINKIYNPIFPSNGGLTTVELNKKSYKFRISVRSQAYDFSQLSSGNINNTEHHFLSSQFTVVVCVDSHDYSGDEKAKIKSQLDEIARIRKDAFFNIITVKPKTANDDIKFYSIPAYLTYHYPRYYRGEAYTDVTLEKLVDMTLSSHFYKQIGEIIKILDLLSDYRALEEKLHSIKHILKKAGLVNFDGNNSIKRSRESFVSNNNVYERKQLFNDMKNLLSDVKDTNLAIDVWAVIANIILSICVLLVSLTIVGLYLSYMAASHNIKHHNNIFKFYATNQRDRARGIIATAEEEVDKLTHTLSNAK